MRWLGLSLVALTLVFTTGGVAIVGHADSGADGAAAQSQCPAPVVIKRSATAKPQVPRANPDNRSIVLNTSGYNYPLEGQWHPDPSVRPSGVPDGVLPEELEEVPAAPASK